MAATETSASVFRDYEDGHRLEFVNGEGRHRAYYLHVPDVEKRKRLPSVSTVLNCLAKPALYRWHEEQGAIGAVKALQLGELDGLADDEIVGRVRLLDLGADAAKRKAAKRGLDVHDALEAWSRTGDLPSPADMDPDHRPYLQGLARALLALDPEPVAVEQITCSVEHGVAGRFDLLAMVGGVLTLCDLKTSRSGHPYPEAHAQMAAYSLCEAERGGRDAERLLAVGVGPDGSFVADEGQATTETFLAVLATYRAMQKVQRGVDGLRRAERKAQEAMA